jgi:hypothetical protein
MRDLTQEGDIINTLVRFPVISNKARPVKCEYHRKSLNTDIVENLVERSLKEGRIYCADWFSALAGESRGKGDRMLLTNTDIKEPLRMRSLERIQSRSTRHGGGDRDHVRVAIREFDGSLRKNLRISRRQTNRSAGLPWRTTRRIKQLDGVPLNRVLLSEMVAFALNGVDMDEGWYRLSFCVFQRREQFCHVVPIDRANVAEPKRVEKHRGARDKPLNGFFSAIKCLKEELGHITALVQLFYP